MNTFGGAPMASGSPAMAPGMAMMGNQMGGTQAAGTWNAATQFSAPNASNKPLDTWEKYAQILLLANEMTFVD